ncbi:MAG TPA: hypothetical protein VIU12_33100 [Chryseolinea sp.]
MGAYNILNAKINCTNCSGEYSGKLQFKVGEVWQYDYQIGDIIKIRPGDQALLGMDVIAYGILENSVCPACAFSNQEEYDILIKDLTIVGYKLMLDYSSYLSHEGGDYFLPVNTKHNRR